MIMLLLHAIGPGMWTITCTALIAEQPLAPVTLAKYVMVPGGLATGVQEFGLSSPVDGCQEQFVLPIAESCTLPPAQIEASFTVTSGAALICTLRAAEFVRPASAVMVTL